MKTTKLTTPILLCGLLLIALLAGLLLAMRHADDAERAEAEAAAEALAASQEPALPWDLAAPDTAPAGVSYADGVYTVTAAGAYRLAGAMTGAVAVEADGPVTLTLAGVDITGERCLRVLSDAPVTIVLAAGTENRLADSAAIEPASGESSATPASEGPVSETDASGTDAETENATGAVVYSRAPLTIEGEGALTVTARVNNGVQCRDTLSVEGGFLTVDAAHHGLKAKGALAVTGGTLTIDAGGDGLCAEAARLTTGDITITSTDLTVRAGGRGIDADGTVRLGGDAVRITAANDAVRGDYAEVRGGILTFETNADAIQAETDLLVSGGELSILAGGGGGQAIEHPGESFGPWAQSAAAEDDVSTKGLKAGGSITITGGVIDLNTGDDCIHCGAVFTMDDGALTILSNDDAIHADDMLVINGGTVDITDCFEGLEAFAVEIRGGDVVIRAVNDGINANGREMMFHRSSDAETETEITSASDSATTYVLMAGGTVDLVVTGNAQNQGDGIDSNGAVYVTGGELVVSTFGTFMENGLDTGWGGPVVTGGKVIAGGSSTMAEGFSSYSTQCAAVVATSYMPDGTEVVLSDAEGNILWEVTMADAFSCLQISHPAMQVGQVYTLTYGSESTTLDFTSSNLVQNTRGFGFRPF